MTHSLYILQSLSSGKYYVGISSNSKGRLEYHNTIEKGFTSRYRPWKIIFEKEYSLKSGGITDGEKDQILEE